MTRIFTRTLPPLLIVALSGALVHGASDLISFEPDARGYLPDGTLATDNLHISTQFRAAMASPSERIPMATSKSIPDPTPFLRAEARGLCRQRLLGLCE